MNFFLFGKDLVHRWLITKILVEIEPNLKQCPLKKYGKITERVKRF